MSQESETSTSWWVKVLAGSGGDLTDQSSSEEYLVLPKASSPRVVVDRSEERAVRDAMERMAASRTNIGAVKSIVGGASSLMIKKKPTWAVSPGRSGQTLREHLCEVLNTDLRISISVGPPRPNRKPVIRCYRDDGLFAVAKLGLEAHTGEMVETEARWLDVMAARPLTNVVTAPVLHFGAYDTRPLLVMSALDLASDLGLEFADVPLSLAKEFSDRFAESTSAADSEWWHRLPTRMDNAQLDSVKAQMSQLSKAADFLSVTVSAWHGDWSPWNMGYSTTGKLCIWDWERAHIGVPVGFDVCHLHYQYGEGLQNAGDDLVAMGVPVELHNMTKRLYLFELCARHNEASTLHTERQAKVVSTLEELANE